MGIFSEILDRKKKEPVTTVFGAILDKKRGEEMAKFLPSPDLGNTSNSSTAFGVPAVPLQFDLTDEEKADKNADFLKNSKPSFLSQGSIDPVIQQKREQFGEDPGILASMAFGRGHTEDRPLYEEGSIQQELVDEGILGFLTYNFQKQNNPTREQLGEMTLARVEALMAGNEDMTEAEAISKAQQDIFKGLNRTAGVNGALNITDVDTGEDTLIFGDKKSMFMVNSVENIFGALDNPIFLGSTKPVTKGLQKSLTSLVLSKTAADTSTIMKGLGYTDDLIKEYGPKFTNTTKPGVVQDLFEESAKKQRDLNILRKTPLRALDDADLVTPAGNVFRETVTTARKEVFRLFNEIPTELRTDAMRTLRQSFSDAPIPTIEMFNKMVKVLEDAGVSPRVVEARVDDMTAALKAQPESFTAGVRKEIPVTEYVKPAEIKVKSGDIPVKQMPDGGFVTVKDATYSKSGDIFVKGVKYSQDVPIKNGTFKKSGDIFVQGVRFAAAKKIPIKDGRYKTSGKLDIVEDTTPFVQPKAPAVVKAVEAAQDAVKKTDAPAPKKLDEVADIAADNLGPLSVDIQKRYGKGAVTKSKAAKFAKEETKIFNEVAKYAQEHAFVINEGTGNLDEMVQSIPDWIPTELRQVGVFDNLTEMLKSGKTPQVHGSPEMLLYTEMIDESARRSGVIKKGPLPAVNGKTALNQSLREQIGPRFNEPLVHAEDLKAAEGGVDDAIEATKPGDDFADYPYKNGRPYQPEIEAELGPIVEALGAKGAVPLKDSLQLTGTWQDIYRFSETLFNDSYEVVRKAVFDKIDEGKRAFTRTENMLKTKVKGKMLDEFNIRRKSPESRAIMDYGEKNDKGVSIMSADDVIKEFGFERAQDIFAAERWMRGVYDVMIDNIQRSQRKLYPNQPGKITPKRPDYFRHFDEMSGDVEELVNQFENVSLSNTSEKLKFTRKQSIEKVREGKASKRDAVQGMLNYIPQYSYIMHINPEIGRLEKFNELLKGKFGDKLPNYIESVNKAVDDLRGNSNYIDKVFEDSAISSNGLAVVDWANKKAKRNSILFNLSASLAQPANAINSIASAGLHSFGGLTRSVGDVLHQFDEGYVPNWKRGQFLPERLRHEVDQEFNVGMLEHAAEFGTWMISSLDKASNVFIWNSHYQKALKEGVSDIGEYSDAVKYADRLTREMVGGRGILETPLVQKSKVFQIIAPFQYEMTNALFVQGKFISKNEYHKLATMYVGMYAYNGLAGKIKGNEVTINPIDAMVDSYGIAQEDATRWDKTKRIAGRMSGEFVSGVPLGNYVIAGLWQFTGEEGDSMADKKRTRQEFFGDGDPVRFGAAPLLWNSLNPSESWLHPLYMLGIPNKFPQGGYQLEKMATGISALVAGDIKDSRGNSIPVKPGFWGGVQTVMFGPKITSYKYKGELEEEMNALIEDNVNLIMGGNEDQAVENVKGLSPQMSAIYDTQLPKALDAKEAEITAEMKPYVLSVRAVAREQGKDVALEMIQELTELEYKLYERAAGRMMEDKMTPMVRDIQAIARVEGNAAALKIVKDMTPEEFTAYETAADELKKNRAEIILDSKNDPEKFIRTAMDYAYAFGTNPVQAWKIVYAGEIIRDTVGGSFDGVVRTRRMDYEGLEGSKAVKGELMGQDGITDSSTVSLEHLVPVSFGGNNSRDNLALVPKELHDSWTASEVYLSEAVKRQDIDYKEAAVLILRLKGIHEDPITPEEIRKVVGVDKYPSGFDDNYKDGIYSPWTDFGEDSYYIGNEDYITKNGRRRTIGDVWDDWKVKRSNKDKQ